MRFLTIITVIAVISLQAHAASMSGEARKWHKLTFDFSGPATSESATPNPFTHYRLNVTFRHAASGKTYLVPGYYAADGNAANTSATSGNVWRAHFAADETGTWTYEASFRTGTNVATDSSSTAGSSAGFADGDGGSFNIAPTDKTGIDFRGKGRLEYVGKHHLRFAETGGYFMKAGLDAPENLLSYADFDGSFKTDGNKDELVKTWSPHVADWRSGDPVWQGNKGKGLIGAINYLASEGLNAFSFLTMNINGDDKNVFPYTSYAERVRMDVSKLDQWEVIFEHGTRMGMHLHFKTQEIENQNLLDSGDLGPQRILYYRELIARFGHHPALNWNLGEECTATTTRKKSWAQYFHDNDPYKHPIVIHNTTSVLHRELMGDASKLTGFSLQLNASDFTDMFTMTKDYIDRSVAAGKPWVVACDEPGDSQYSLRPDNDAASSHTNARKNALWGNIMAGGAGCEFYFGYALPNSDLTCQDFRSRDAFWDYCRHALAFVKTSTVPFQDMTNQNALVSGSGNNANRCLARTGVSYLVHLPSGGSATLNLSGASGTFQVRWFDPRNGGAMIVGNTVNGGGTVNLGSPPNSTTQDWVALVQDDSGQPPVNQSPIVSAGPDKSAVLVGASVGVSITGTATDDGLPQGSSLVRNWSRVSGPAGVTFSDASSASTTATFTATGVYTLRLSATDGGLSSSDDVVVTISNSAPANQIPVANAGPDATAILSGASTQVNLNGSASDDGLPAGSSLIVAWTRVSGPAAVSFANPSAPATTATFTATGTYVLRLSASDGDLSATDDVQVVVSAPSGGGQDFSPVHDAYLQNGVNTNNSDLRAENTSRSRVIYLQFDLTSIGAASSALLKLTESVEPSGGSLTLRVFAASSNNWTESGISAANAPAKGAQVAVFTGDITDGMSVEFDVASQVTGPGIYSFIIETDASYRDVAFASSENAVIADRPLLIVTSGGAAANQAPVVNAGPDKSAVLAGATVNVALAGSATDDGLPSGSTLSVAWSQVSGPATATFSTPNAAATNVTVNTSGAYVFRLTASDSTLTSSDDISVTITTSGVVSPTSFAATHDAYLQNGTNYNNADLRAETTSRIRKSYLQFDLSTLTSSPDSAVLRVTEGNDTSGGILTVRLFAALSNNWTESAINGTNAPAKGAELASFTGDITDGKTVQFDVGALVTGAGIYSFIVEVDASFRDVAFASAESPTISARPVLEVMVASSTSAPLVASSATDPVPTSDIRPALGRTGGNLPELRATGIAGTRYLIERSVDLKVWSTVDTVTAEENGAILYTDPAPPPDRAFYRISDP